MRRQFVNDPEDVVPEALEGFAAAWPRHVRWNREPSYVLRAEPASDKVAVLSGGGSGHEPLHVGFVGRGMLDAAVPGAVFASPTAMQIRAASLAADTGRGVLHVVKNYTGDVLNFRIAGELLSDEGVRSDIVLVDDDLATDTDDPDGPGRRGTAAVVAVEKVCGAAAERGADLSELVELGRRVVSGSRTLSVALAAGAHPGQSRPSFELPDDRIEFGVGIHGERARERRAFGPRRALVPDMAAPLLRDLDLGRGDRLAVIVNGLGATHDLELYGLFGEVKALLEDVGISVARSLVGSYVTSLDMAGCSVTLVRADDEFLDLWDAPVSTPALTW
ncbi:dihydroxyacetone kinase subunit DhaK [Nocardiopsis sp. NRRL B-16309]|uniref:dihydroxyacetone kinase subunit DhaK n=1 Tax=Nocardiopsis sp. NRRL B-16309 TaxID=1519494 RepID=UPI0006AF548E|nr:dihydroxyacetone kinase subunit DhaK [Nocardiopsis sp. NRRL B-16309]KOX15498.1 dihydroxyacetone kinase [Nocardiopsis sp. NRRL B-16309]